MWRGLALLVMLGVAWSGNADYREAYAQGLKARDEARWRDVAEHMAAAIAEQPAEGRVVRFETYVPYYYLGLAHKELGNCDAAISAWRESLRQGAIQRNAALYEKLQQGLRACEAGQPVEGVPPALVQAASAYFSGDYERVVSLLKDLTLEQRKMAAQQHLFLAAAQYARYVLGGSANNALLRDAEEQVRRVRRADSTIVPRADVFSPRFVAFFNEVQ